MGEGAADLVSARDVERQIEHLRARLDRSLAELDRRRHELTDLRLQVRRHPAMMAAGAGVLAVVVGTAALALLRTRRETWEKVAAAVASALAATAARKLLSHAWNSTTYINRR